MDTDALINKLASEGARKPLPRPWMQLLFWLTGTAAWLAAMVSGKGLRPDLMQKIAMPFFVPELILLLGLALSAGMAGLYLSRPDGGQKPFMPYAPFAFMAGWAVTAFLNAGPMDAESLGLGMDPRGLDCALCILTLSVPPGIAMVLMVRQGAAVESAKAGLMSALSVTASAYLCMRLVEANDNPFHLLFWHAMPVLLLCLTGMAAGRVLFKLK